MLFKSMNMFDYVPNDPQTSGRSWSKSHNTLFLEITKTKAACMCGQRVHLYFNGSMYPHLLPGRERDEQCPYGGMTPRAILINCMRCSSEYIQTLTAAKASLHRDNFAGIVCSSAKENIIITQGPRTFKITLSEPK